MITASVVTYKNKPEILSRTIESYLAATDHARLYVIDNSPTDEAKKICQHPLIQYIFNGANMGYGKAHNIALRESLKESKYHLVLNPDVYFDSHVVKELITFMEKNTHVGLLMPKVLLPNGTLQRLCRLLPVPHQLILRRFFPFLRKTVAHMMHEYEMRFTDYETIENVPFLSGCFMLLRSEALQKVGFFDERFFLYFEDADLSRRIHEHYQTLYYPHVSINHFHERSSYKELKAFLHHVNSALNYFNKWGWFTDTRRSAINQDILIKYRVNGYSKKLS
jgi:hypothetical protein